MADSKHDDLTRRKFIEGTGAAAAAGLLLAGCDGGDGPEADAGPDGSGEGGDSGTDGSHDGGPDSLPPGSPFVEEPYEDPRVVRVYDRRMTDYTFSDEQVPVMTEDPDVIQQMLESGIVDLARAESVGDAWQALLPGELPGAKVAVKINLNGRNPRNINTSPAMVIALARSLMSVGIRAEDMTFFDRSREFHESYAEAIREEVSDLVLLGQADIPVHETELISAPSQVLEDESVVAVPAALCLVEADHFINVHMVKGHSGGGTGAMKNLFGFAWNVYDTFHGSRAGLQLYHHGSQCADLATQPLIRSKSRLLIAEGAFSAWWHADKPPDRFRNEALYPDGLVCSLLLGRNPLYQDTVICDMVEAERAYGPLPDGQGPDEFPDDWLRNAAAEPYNLGVYDRGGLTEGTFTAQDLTYDTIEYRSFTTEV